MNSGATTARGCLSVAVAVAAVLWSCAAANAASIFRVGDNGPFGSFSAIAAGPHGTMWVAQDAPLDSSGAARYAVARLDLSGGYRLYRTRAETNGIAVSGSGTVFATERYANRIAIVGRGGAVREVSLPTPAADLGSIVVGRDGNGWFVEERGNRIGRITPSGTIAEFPVPPVPDWETGTPVAAGPTAIAAGRDMRMWFAINNGIATITTDGLIVEHTWALGFPADPISIATAADGTAWTADGEQREIEHVDAGGNPASLALAADAPALLVEPGGALSAFDTTGPYRWRVRAGMPPLRQTLTVVEHNGTRDLVTASGLQPAAVGPAGTVWITADLVSQDGGEVPGVVVLNDAGHCIVPDLDWDTLGQARRELEQHSCRVGKVRLVNRLRLPVGDLRVGAQSAPAGKVLRHRAPVSVTLTIR